ncbi:hypothetical protein RKD22_003792 [Streptomyces pristinaespiralis]
MGQPPGRRAGSAGAPAGACGPGPGTGAGGGRLRLGLLVRLRLRGWLGRLLRLLSDGRRDRLGRRGRGRGRRGNRRRRVAARRGTGGGGAGTRRDGRVRLGVRPGHVSHGGALATGRERRPPLQAVQPGPHRPLVVEGRRQQHPGADQLQLEPRRRGSPHLGQARVDEVRGPAELGGAEHGGLRLHPLDHVRRGVDQPLGARVRHGGEDHQVAQPLQQVRDEPARVVPAFDDAVHDLEGGGSVTRREGVHDGVEQRTVRVAEQGRRHGVCHTVVGGAGEQLVHDGHGVTHRPRAGPYHQREHAVLHRDALPAAHLRQIRPERPGWDEAERVVVRTRPDGADDLLGLGGREDELQVLRGLLDHLQQGVEPRRGDHVGLVDDVDLVAAARGAEEGLLAQLTRVIHTTVRGGVDLDDVDGPGSGARQVLAGLALAAGRRRRPLLAVQTTGEDAGAGRLSAAARPAEQVRVIDPVVAQGLLERVSDMLLTDDLCERLGAVAAVQRKGRHTYEVIGAHGQPEPPRIPRERKRPPRTRQSRPTLAAFRPWGSSVR